MANRGDIKDFLTLVGANGGMAMSNSFLVKFNFPSFSIVPNALSSAGVGFSNNSNDVVELFCDEAQLPNINAATGSVIGRYLGEGQVEYPTSKVFTDFQLSWMCDANMIPHKFVTAWFDSMFVEEYLDGNRINAEKNTGKDYSDVLTANTRTIARSTKLRFPSEYQCEILIGKTEPGPNSATHRASEIFVIQDAFPYQIDAVPLSYGPSQVVKVSASFKYTRHFVVYNDIRSMNSLQGTNSAKKKQTESTFTNQSIFTA